MKYGRERRRDSAEPAGKSWQRLPGIAHRQARERGNPRRDVHDRHEPHQDVQADDVEEKASRTAVREERLGERRRHQDEDDGRREGDDGLGKPGSALRDGQHDGISGKEEPESQPGGQAAENPYRWVTREPAKAHDDIVVGLSAGDRL